MGKQASTIIRELVLKLRNEGKTFSEIGSIKNRSHNTVKKVIDKYEQFGTIEFRPGAGRPKVLNNAEVRPIVCDVKKNPFKSVVKISQEASPTSDTSVSASTIRRALHANGLHGRFPRKKPLISAANQKRSLDYAKKGNKDVSFWNNVLFSDESKF